MSDLRVRHDRLTVYTYIGLTAYVWAMYALGPSLLLLRIEQGTSRTISSLHSSALSIGVLVLGMAGARITARLGRALTIRSGQLLVVAGVLLVLFGPSPLVSIPGGFLIGFGGAAATNASNAFLTLHHGRAGAAAISESNTYAALAALVAPLLVGAMVAWQFSWRWGMGASVAIFALAQFFGRDGHALEVRGPEHHDVGTRLPALYWWAWVLMGLNIGTEFSFMLWSGDLLRERAGFSTAAAAAGLGAVTAGMMVSRAAIPALLRRYDSEWLLRLSILVPLVMWVPLWLSTNGLVMLTSMFVMGCGIGFHFPMGMSRMLDAAPGMADLAAARSAVASGGAGSILPFLLGAAADAIGMHAAFTLVPLLLAGAWIIARRFPVPRPQHPLPARE